MAAGLVVRAAMLLVVRPVAVAIGLLGAPTRPPQRGLIGWFGIRGIGSLYYLMYAINHGLDRSWRPTSSRSPSRRWWRRSSSHGISVTPLMAVYERTKGNGAKA